MKNGVLFSATFAVTLFFTVYFTGCPEETEDLSINEVTIFNIPKEIPVYGKPEAAAGGTFKIYISASNHKNENYPHSAQGMAEISEAATESDGTYTVKIQLYKPAINLKYYPEKERGKDAEGNLIERETWNKNFIATAHKDEQDPGCKSPNCQWSGTTHFFSVILCPEFKTEDNEKVIYMKGSLEALNKTKTHIDWNKLLDFREQIDIDKTLNKTMDFSARTAAFYEQIICRDPDIKSMEEGN